MPVLEALIYGCGLELLLILDNCEHLLDACAGLVGALLRAAPGLRVPATSRESLGITGEVTYPVQPLDLPPETAQAREAGQAAAVRLFLDRGSAARGGSAGGVAPVGWRSGSAGSWTVCRWRSSWPRHGLARCLRWRSRRAWRTVPVPGLPSADADPRHQALRAAMDWSYELLSAEGAGCVSCRCSPGRSAWSRWPRCAAAGTS